MSKKNKGGVKTQATTKQTTTAKAEVKDEKKVATATSTEPKKPAAKKAEVPEPPKIETTQVTVMTPQENTPTAVFLKSILDDSKRNDGGLSPDSTVTLANLIQRRYVENKSETVQKFGQPFLDGMNTVADALIVTTVIQQVVSTNTPFALLIKNSAYPQIQSLAKTFGVELPPVDKLALPTMADGKHDGVQLELEFKPDMVSEDTKKRVLKEAAKAAENAPELDPTKLKSNEDVAAAITHLLSKRDDLRNGIAKNLLSAIKLVKDYRYNAIESFANAEKEEQKKVLDARTIGDWMTDMATFSEPTLIYETLGYAMVKTVVNEKCPIGAFLDARHIFTNKGECAFTDEEIAIIVKMLVNWYCTYSKAKNNDILTKSKKITETAKNAAKAEIERCNEALHYISNFDGEIVKSVEDVFTAESTSVAKKLYYFTRGQYYGREISGTKNPEAEFVNLLHNVCQRIGIIANMFRSIVDHDDNYMESNIESLIKRPETNTESAKTEGDAEKKADGDEPATKEGESAKK